MFRYLFLLIIISFFGCEDDNLKEVPTTLIARGNLGGAGEEGIIAQNLVIDNNEDWDALLQQVDAVNEESPNFSETSVDFDSFQVIAIFDEVRPSAGYSIDLSVTESNMRRTATVTYTQPSGIVLTVITQPYLIIKVPRSGSPIAFH